MDRARTRPVAVGVLLLLLSGFVMACSAIDDGSSANIRVSTATPEPEISTPTPGETASPTASPAPGETATATPGDEPEGETPVGGDLAGALAAASSAIGVPAGDDCAADEDCIRALPDGQSDASGPVTRLAYQIANGGGALVIVGRDGAGVWQFWMLTQGAPYQLLSVPGELRSCGDTSALDVRESPSDDAAVAGEWPHDAVAQADDFVITRPGTLDDVGSAWYHISGDVEGWVPSTHTADAATGDCSLRNETERESGTRG